MDPRRIVRDVTLFVSLMLCQVCGAVDAPSLHCVSVEENGHKTLSWSAPADPSNFFVRYIVFRSQQPTGPYQAIDSVDNRLQVTYQDDHPSAATLYYFLRTEFNDGLLQLSDPSDTLNSMVLSLTKAGGANDSALLSWEAASLSVSSPYYIETKEQMGNWQKVDSLPGGAINHPLFIESCQDTTSFRIATQATNGCLFFSNVAKGSFKDTIQPSNTTLDSVSVDSANQAILLGWQHSTALDVEGYIIVHPTQGGATQLDTARVPDNHFIDSLTGNITGVLNFDLATFDRCFNTTTTAQQHTTMFASASAQACDSLVAISWTPYQGWDNGIAQHNILFSQNDGAWQLLAQKGPNEFSMVHTGIDPNAKYCYKIRAIAAVTGFTSTSNTTCIGENVAAADTTLYLANATFNASNQVDLSIRVDSQPTSNRLAIKRSARMDGPYEVIGVLPAPDKDSVLAFNDITTDGGEALFYRVHLQDTCGIDLAVSNLARPILLSLAQQDDWTNQLSWSSYDYWSAANSDVIAYTLEVLSSEHVLIDQISFSPADALAHLYQFISDSGFTALCFKVVANEGTNNVFGLQMQSQSNIVCVEQLPIVWVPNTFSPNGDGKNDVFKPVLKNLDFSNYHLAIFDRNGLKIFETEDPSISWDGTAEGRVYQGVYVYLIEVQHASGNKEKQVGSVLLLE